MNQLAIDMFSTVGVAVLCIVLGIIALTLFFITLSRMGNRESSMRALSVSGILTEESWANVELNDGKKFARVRILGFTDSSGENRGLPYDMTGMVVLEDAKGNRTLVRSKTIRIITILSDSPETV